MKIEYQKTRGPHGEAVYIPMVPFAFRRVGGGTVGGYALVDSGATRSFFHAKYATEIGIEDVESGPRVDECIAYSKPSSPNGSLWYDANPFPPTLCQTGWNWPKNIAANGSR